MPFQCIVAIKDFAPSRWLRDFLGAEQVKLPHEGEHPLAEGFAAPAKREASEAIDLADVLELGNLQSAGTIISTEGQRGPTTYA